MRRLPLAITPTNTRNDVDRQQRVASLFDVPPPPPYLKPLTTFEWERWRVYYVGRHPTDWARHDLHALHELVKLETRYESVCESYDLSTKYIEMQSGRYYAHPAFAHMVRLGDMVARRRSQLGFTYNVSRDALERFGRRELEAETQSRDIVQREQEAEDLLAAPMGAGDAPQAND